MLAFAFHLLRSVLELYNVSIHPDGEHANRSDFKTRLNSQGFGGVQPFGRTAMAVSIKGPTEDEYACTPRPGQATSWRNGTA